MGKKRQVMSMTQDTRSREEMLARIAEYCCTQQLAHPVRVAIDGRDAAGKTTMADELAQIIRQHARPVIRISEDDFQHPRSQRYRRGALSAKGYYHDAFHTAALIACVLAPLGPGGNLRYQAQFFDYRNDQLAPVHVQLAHAHALVLVDGVFLLRQELRAYWDVTIRLEVPAEVALARALERDHAYFGSDAITQERYRRRYQPAQEYYRVREQPEQYADILIEHTHPSSPILTIRRTPPTC